MSGSARHGTAAGHADTILRAAIAAADPYDRVIEALRAAPELRTARHVCLIAAGKAACRMAAAAREALGSRIDAAAVVVPHGTDCPGALHAAHPLPDADSVRAARAITDAVGSAPEDTVILVLLSGGASALMTLPVHGIEIADYADCVHRLQRAGADIVELNTVRHHIDQLKGGGLARLAAPRAVLGLVLSDVVGDPLDIIASGPLTTRQTTPADALHILRRHSVLDDCAPSIPDALRRAAFGSAGSEPAAARARIALVGTNATARAGAAAAARALGYAIVRRKEPLTGEAREAGRLLAREALERRRRMKPDDAPACIIAGGETIVTVRGNGTGGRNQELVLAAALDLDTAAADDVTIASAGTDGVDGTSDAAGAIADAALIRDARAHGIDARHHLDDNDSDGFFRRAGGRFHTGPTGTNVMDVQLVLIEPPVVRD